MNFISQYFERIIKKQKELNYYFPQIIQQPASLKDIEATELLVGFKFNQDLIELYSFANGTKQDYETPCGKTGLIPIHNFLNLERAIEYYQIYIGFEDSFLNTEINFRPGKHLFPILEDGAGNCYWVDLNENTENRGKLFWTNTFGQEPCYKFESLTLMFEVICECYETGIFTLDNEGYLDCNYSAFEEVSRRLNPNI